MGAITPVDYSLLARGIEVNDEHSAIIESRSLNFSSETTAFTYMVGTPEEVAVDTLKKIRFLIGLNNV